MSLSEEISRLAQEYDRNQRALTPTDENATRAFVQGMLCAEMMKQRDPTTQVLKVDTVEQVLDTEGNYLPYFTVVTRSGARIRVSVEVE